MFFKLHDDEDLVNLELSKAFLWVLLQNDCCWLLAFEELLPVTPLKDALELLIRFYELEVFRDF